MAEMMLTVWLHPSMQSPIKLEDRIFRVNPQILVVDLMDECEEAFEEAAQAKQLNVELQINVLWNIKDHKKALNPNDPVGQHFASGETFGVYGDIQPVPAFQCPGEKPEEEKTPVTILTGFLGSGKTTLLNYILNEQRDKKIAVIENEFGEISIDDALLKKDKMALAEKVVVMDNGCMCCTIRGDLVNGLKSILSEIRSGNTIDTIMIETTGMADPVPIVRTFMSSPELTVELRLDAVITLADAKNILGRLDDKVEDGKVNEAYQQVAFADKIILNKLDLISTDIAIQVKDRIRSINKYAKIIPAVRSRVKVSELANIRAHDMTNFVNEEGFATEAEVPMELEHGGGGDHGGGHGEDLQDHGAGGHGGGGHEGGGGHGDGGNSGGHGTAHGTAHGGAHGAGHGPGRVIDSRHDSRVNSFSIVKEGEIIQQRLTHWMQALGQLPPERGTIFRIKAILAVKNYPYKHVFHAVMDVSDEDDAGPWAPDEKKISKIVFIGKAMDRAYLTMGFEAIFE